MFCFSVAHDDRQSADTTSMRIPQNPRRLALARQIRRVRVAESQLQRRVLAAEKQSVGDWRGEVVCGARVCGGVSGCVCVIMSRDRERQRERDREKEIESTSKTGWR